jgi:TRAP-type C4-dicarboxylate transport system substrate-binding protein
MPQHGSFASASALALVLAACAGAAARAQSTAKRSPPKLPPTKVKELATQWFATDAAGRTKIESQLAPADELTPEQAKAWAPQLYELARKGRKLESGGTNWFLDPKEKVG